MSPECMQMLDARRQVVSRQCSLASSTVGGAAAMYRSWLDHELMLAALYLKSSSTVVQCVQHRRQAHNLLTAPCVLKKNADTPE